MNVEFLKEAEKELFEAVIWYESQEVGLGARFRDEIAHLVNRIADDPLLWRERTRWIPAASCMTFVCLSFKERKSPVDHRLDPEKLFQIQSVGSDDQRFDFRVQAAEFGHSFHGLCFA